jgi:hypothetical protein
MPPDIFRAGIVGERLMAQLTGAGKKYDQHHSRDVAFHLDTFREHREGFSAALARHDGYNAVIERIDADLNYFFAWIVASRIVDEQLRSEAFGKLADAA